MFMSIKNIISTRKVVILSVVSLLILFLSISCFIVKKNQTINLYNYVIDDYGLILKIDSVKLLKNPEAKQDIIDNYKLLNEPVESLEYEKNMIFVVLDEDIMYCLGSNSIAKTEYLQYLGKKAEIKEVVLEGKTFYWQIPNEETKTSLDEDSCYYFIDDFNYINADDEYIILDILNILELNKSKDKVVLQKDISNFDKYPIWGAFHLNGIEGYMSYQVPNEKIKKYNLYAEAVIADLAEYKEYKKQYFSMRSLGIGMLAMQLKAQNLSKQLDKDLKVEFIEKDKKIKLNFSYLMNDYKAYIEKLFEIFKKFGANLDK